MSFIRSITLNHVWEAYKFSQLNMLDLLLTCGVCLGGRNLHLYDKHLRYIKLQELKDLKIQGIGAEMYFCNGYLQIKLSVDPFCVRQLETLDTLAIVCSWSSRSTRSSLIMGINTNLERWLLALNGTFHQEVGTPCCSLWSIWLKSKRPQQWKWYSCKKCLVNLWKKWRLRIKEMHSLNSLQKLQWNILRNVGTQTAKGLSVKNNRLWEQWVTQKGTVMKKSLPLKCPKPLYQRMILLALCKTSHSEEYFCLVLEGHIKSV